MPTATGKYLGDLRTVFTHDASGGQLLTDAPVDNHGRGEAFSPTDTVCAALSACMMTLMGIYARRENLDMTGMESRVTKHMSASPRRISRIEVEFSWPAAGAGEHQVEMMKRTAMTCPVALSLHPDIELDVRFAFGEVEG